MWAIVLREEIFFLANLAAVENKRCGCPTGSRR